MPAILLLRGGGDSREPTGGSRTRVLARHLHGYFVAATFDRLHGVLVGGAKLKVRHIYVDGDTTIAELRASSKTNEGATFANNYCWVCRFDGETIVEVRACLDSAMVDYTIDRNENLAWR